MSGKVVTAGMKLMIRADAKAGVVRAFFAMEDESEKFEVATISIQLLHDNPGLFDTWKDALGKAVKRFVADVTGMITNLENRVSEKN